MPEQTTQQELLEVVERLNQDETVDGILVQLPSKQIDEKTVSPRCKRMWTASIGQRWTFERRGRVLCTGNSEQNHCQCFRNTASTSQERTVLSSAEATSWANRWQRCC